MREYEGEALLGRWLPAALADILSALVGLGGRKADRREIFESWGLAWMAQMLGEQEECGRQDRLDKLADQIAALEEGE